MNARTRRKRALLADRRRYNRDDYLWPRDYLHMLTLRGPQPVPARPVSELLDTAVLVYGIINGLAPRGAS